MPAAQQECPVALVVEDDASIRDLAAAVLDETDLTVIACESAEAAISVLEKPGVNVALLFADLRLAGKMDGAALARTVERRWPSVRMVVTSGYGRSEGLPRRAIYMQKPWSALDVLVQAERATEAAAQAA